MTLVVALSVASSISFLANLWVIRWMANNKRIRVGASLLRMGIAFSIGLVSDLITIVLLISIILFGGRALGLFVEETFEAQIEGGWLGYGFAIGAGDVVSSTTGTARFGTQILRKGVDFEELRREVPRSNWLVWLLPSASFNVTAAALCERYDIQLTCRDRLRTVYFHTFDDQPLPASDVVEAIKGQAYMVSSLACGCNIWSTLPKGTGANEGLKLALPFVMAFAGLLLSKILMIPVLIAICLLDFLLVRLGRYVVRSSEHGFSIIARYGLALLTAPPAIAVSLILFFYRWQCQ